MDYNRLSVIKNPYQQNIARILCVGSGGVLRSPTTALVLSSEPYNFNTRSAGTEDYALIRVDEALLLWAQAIVVMEERHEDDVKGLLDDFKIKHPPIARLNIPDSFEYRSPKLGKLIHERLPATLGASIIVKR
jgi:predicted protein tyrosine phosphatase